MRSETLGFFYSSNTLIVSLQDIGTENMRIMDQPNRADVLSPLTYFADLMRSIDAPCEIDFMAVSSYGSQTDSSGVVRILKDLDAPIQDRDVLIVEDIIDSGLTLQYLMRNLGARDPASLEVCSLLTKPERLRVDLPAKYVGFEIPNEFAIGYGLDHAQRYRNLDYVAALVH